MKNFLTFLIIASLALAACKKSEPPAGSFPQADPQTAAAAPQEKQQDDGPVYVPGAFGIISICVSEFAVNGPDKELIKEVEPYIQNGRVYFSDAALPISTGSLRPGFEFNLDFEHDEKPRIKAVYRGQQKDVVTAEDIKDGLHVAGFAERGSITITHVFFDRDSYDKWGDTVRFFD